MLGGKEINNEMVVNHETHVVKKLVSKDVEGYPW
jgi:hypothetical protein